MPTYEYACKSCGEHLEVVQSFKDPSLTTCPACGGQLRKVFGSIGISFKGSGFYKTDSRSSTSTSSSSSSKSSESKTSTESTSSESSSSKTESSGKSESAPSSPSSSGAKAS